MSTMQGIFVFAFFLLCLSAAVYWLYRDRGGF